MDSVERRKRWVEAALQGELRNIENLPAELKINKPNNPYWQSLFRIAGLAKGGYVTKDDAFVMIIQVSGHLQFREEQIAYQWNRAYKRASPRHPKGL